MTTQPHHRFPDVTWQHVCSEITREIAYRMNAYPRLVEKGRMAQRDADRELAIMDALGQDAARFAAADAAGGATPAPKHAFTWRDRHAAIVRELAWRARVYPELARKGRPPSPDQAEIYNRRLACLQAVYEEGRDWIPANGAARPFLSGATPATLEARTEWCALAAGFAQRDGRAAEFDGYLRMIAIADPKAAAEVRAMYAPQEEFAL